MASRRIPATYMRGGTSKGVFFEAGALPADAACRDALLLRALGSPDRYGKQIDGLGAGSSSTSKVAIVSRSARPDSDVDYLFGAVSIEAPLIDWSGNCGNLSAAVGPFAIAAGLADAPADGVAVVRIWQANLGRRIVAHVPMSDGQPAEAGDFALDGVAFGGAEIRLEFLEPAGSDGALFPTGAPLDRLEVPDTGVLDATLIDAGNPAVFVDAAALGLAGTELAAAVDSNAALLARCERIRAHAAVAMGLAQSAAQASRERPATPKLAFVSAPVEHRTADGRTIAAGEVDLVARIFSMGRLHHAMTGTGAVALAAAAAVPGTVVQRAMRPAAPAPAPGWVRLAHPSGRLAVGAQARRRAGRWRIDKVVLSRSARRLMEGWVVVPNGSLAWPG